jgi:hypothetical protein
MQCNDDNDDDDGETAKNAVQFENGGYLFMQTVTPMLKN